MRKPLSDGGLVGVLNLILVMTAAVAVYFGIVASPAGRGEDVREAFTHIGEDFAGILARSTPPFHQTGAVPEGAASHEDAARDIDVVYASFLSEITAKKQREAIEEDRITGLLSRLETSVRESRYEEAGRIAREMEAVAQRYSGDGGYLYLARSVARLVERSGVRPGDEAQLRALREEFDRLAMEREFYRNNLQDALAEQRFAESALALQESNAQIQEMLLQTVREQYAQSQEALSVARAQLDSGETLVTLEAKEYTREGYREGIGEARDLLEQSLRIRSRDSRIAFLHEARTRYPPDSAMATLINTLLERL
ncbi:MAG: hypothetical protein LBT00_14215 [Spirochaetaceae bacterium]|jgi:hypothetical protein|nr:hypothetical protein [Spirochaetaceae bacterium]